MTKITLITGGSRGLGRNTALHIARQGGDVILTYRSQAAEADAVVTEIRALGRQAVALPLDTGDVASFGAFVSALRAALRDTWQRNRGCCPTGSDQRNAMSGFGRSSAQVAAQITRRGGGPVGTIACRRKDPKTNRAPRRFGFGRILACTAVPIPPHSSLMFCTAAMIQSWTC